MVEKIRFVRIKEAHRFIEAMSSEVLTNINKVIAKTRTPEGDVLLKGIESTKPNKSNVGIVINMLLDNVPEDKAPSQELLDVLLAKCEDLYDVVKSAGKEFAGEQLDKLAFIMSIGFACANMFVSDVKDVEKHHQFISKQIINMFNPEKDMSETIELILGKQIADLTLSAAITFGKMESMLKSIPAVIYAAFNLYLMQYNMIVDMLGKSETEPIMSEEGYIIEAKPSTAGALNQLKRILKKTKSPEAEALMDKIDSLPPTKESIETAFDMLVEVLPENKRPAQTVLDLILSYAKMLYDYIISEAKTNPVYANDKRLDKFAFNMAIGFISTNLLVKKASKIDKHYNDMKKQLTLLFEADKRTAKNLIKQLFGTIVGYAIMIIGVFLTQPLMAAAGIPILIYACVRSVMTIYNALVDIFVGRDIYKGTQEETREVK